MKKFLKAIKVIIIALLLSLPAIPAAATPILYFYTDFNNGLPAEFSGATNLESVQGYAGIGTGTNVFSGNMLRNPTSKPAQPTTLTLTNLPSHTSVNLNFLFAAIDSWDGVNNKYGIDYLNVTVDGTLVFTRALMAVPPPPGEQLIMGYYQSGWGLNYGDHAYNLGIDSAFTNIAHSAGSLTIAWYASGSPWQGGLDESWGIDNVGVTLDLIPTPEPATILLLGFLTQTCAK